MNPVLERYLSIPGWAWLWVAFAASIGVFAWRASFFVRALRLGRPDQRLDRIPERLRNVLQDVLLQRKMRDGVIWPAHLAIFYGFLVFAFAFGLTLLKGLFPILPYPWPEEIGPLGLLLEVWALLVLAGLAAAAFRRFVLRPAGVKQSLDAAFILTLIAALMVTALLGTAFRRVAEGEPATAWSPVASLLAGFFGDAGLSPAAAGPLQLSMWWGHVLLVLGFLAYLPFSKHLHLLVAPLSVFLTDLKPMGVLPSDEAPTTDQRNLDLRDFTWRELLSPLACAECGRCDRSCPAFGSGSALSPQTLIHHLKDHILQAGPLLVGGGSVNGHLKPLVGGLVSEEELWACATCGACRERCAVRNEHLPILVRMRRDLVARGKVDDQVQEALSSLARYGNSFGQSERARARWSQGLPFRIRDARREPVEFLWFVGDFASYDPRAQQVTRTVARLFDAAGLDFGILHEAERNAGNDARRMGEEGLFDLLAEKNAAALSKCRFNEIVTTDPHTYNTLKNEYPPRGAAYQVSHYTEVLWRLIESGRLPLKKKLDVRVSYHDPCYLGRYNGVYDAPRRVLRAAGAGIVEMPRHGSEAYCCGAGGGRIWMEDRPGSGERPSESRLREAVALPGVEVLAVACPKDLVMFQDAAKTTGSEGKVAVRDVAELVWSAAA